MSMLIKFIVVTALLNYEILDYDFFKLKKNQNFTMSFIFSLVETDSYDSS